MPSQTGDQAQCSLFYYPTSLSLPLIFCSLFPSIKCFKEEKKKKVGKRRVWLSRPITQRSNSQFPFSRLSLVSTPAPPKGKQRAPSRSHLSCHRAAPAGTAIGFPAPHGPHCRCCVTATLASSCSHLRLRGRGDRQRFLQHVSFCCSISGKKRTFYFNRGVNTPRPLPTATLFQRRVRETGGCIQSPQSAVGEEGGAGRGVGGSKVRPAGTGAGAPGVTAATPRRVLAPALRLRALLAGRERGWEVRPRCAAEVANIGTCRSGRPRHCCHPGVVLPATGWKTEISLLPLPPSPPPLRTPPTQPHPNPSEGAASASPSPRRRFPAAPRAPAGPLPPPTHTPHPGSGLLLPGLPPSTAPTSRPTAPGGQGADVSPPGLGVGVPRPGFCFMISIQTLCQRPCRLTPERASQQPPLPVPGPFHPPWFLAAPVAESPDS